VPQIVPVNARSNGQFVGEMRTSRLPGMPLFGCQVYNMSTNSTYILKISSHILNPRERFVLLINCVGSTLQTKKRGWARSMMPKGSASTNNSLEAFNGNVLSQGIVCGTRPCMSQLFSDFEGLFRSQSNRSASNLEPLTAADGRPNVRSTSRMNMRLKQWYAKAIDINTSYEDGPLRCYNDDSNGGFHIVSWRYYRGGKPIDMLLENSAVVFSQAMSACAVAGCALAEWSSIRLAAGRGELAETTVNSIFLRLKEAWTKIRESLSDSDTSFYHLHLIPDACNKAMLCASQQATFC
jgi:hypothetical protein